MKIRTASSFRLGQIRYTNTLPFYHGLVSMTETADGGLKSLTGTPAEINRKISEGEIDIAPISSLEYLNHQERYLLFPDLCIGSRDFSGSVLLLSKEPIQGLKDAPVALTAASLSAATLLKILLKFKFQFENSFPVESSPPDQMLQHTRACLAIGDEALFFRPQEFVYKTDLSQVWWEWTARPFCFSLWAVRRSYYEKNAEGVNGFYRRLKSNLENNLQDLEKLLREGLGLRFTDERFATVFGYLFNLNYGLDEEMKKGLELFYEYAHRLGVSPQPKKLEFIEG